jgi:arylformamidase
MPRLMDLSHTVEHGTITYPGLPAPVITDFLSREASVPRYAPGVSFHIGRIDMVANTGTYLDAPSHRYEHGSDLSQLRLEQIAAIAGIVIRARDGRAIDRRAVAGRDVAGKAVLVDTGWSVRWGTDDYFSGSPFLTSDAAESLREAGAALVGIDSLNIDDTGDLARPAHSLLLAAGIPIVEHLTALAELPDQGFTFFAVPVKVRGMGTFPVRAFALIDSP